MRYEDDDLPHRNLDMSPPPSNRHHQHHTPVAPLSVPARLRRNGSRDHIDELEKAMRGPHQSPSARVFGGGRAQGDYHPQQQGRAGQWIRRSDGNVVMPDPHSSPMPFMASLASLYNLSPREQERKALQRQQLVDDLNAQVREKNRQKAMEAEEKREEELGDLIEVRASWRVRGSHSKAARAKVS